MTAAEMRTDEEILGRIDVNDVDAITELARANVDPDEVAHAVADQADALFTWDSTKAARPKLDNAVPRPPFERGIARVLRFLIRAVSGRVIAADEGPSSVLTGVLVRTMQRVAVEHHRRTRLQLYIDSLTYIRGRSNAFFVSSRLLADFAVVDSTDVVRAL